MRCLVVHFARIMRQSPDALLTSCTPHYAPPALTSAAASPSADAVALRAYQRGFYIPGSVAQNPALIAQSACRMGVQGSPAGRAVLQAPASWSQCGRLCSPVSPALILKPDCK